MARRSKQKDPEKIRSELVESGNRGQYIYFYIPYWVNEYTVPAFPHHFSYRFILLAF